MSKKYPSGLPDGAGHHPRQEAAKSPGRPRGSLSKSPSKKQHRHSNRLNGIVAENSRMYNDPSLSGNFDAFTRAEQVELIDEPLADCRTFKQFVSLAQWAIENRLGLQFAYKARELGMDHWLVDLEAPAWESLSRQASSDLASW